MTTSTMRSRFLPELTNSEVEQYLDRADLIYVPVGTVETHGNLPLDCEMVFPEAFAMIMADLTDGLVLPHLLYFYSAKMIGRGTVQMSVLDGIKYLDRIATSLLNQGFRRQVYLSFHGQAYLTINSMIVDFFHRTSVPILYIDLVNVLLPRLTRDESYAESRGIYDMFLGAYALLGRLEDVPLNMPNPDDSDADTTADELSITVKAYIDFIAEKLHCRPFGAVGLYGTRPSDHGGPGTMDATPTLETIEERAQRARGGVDRIKEIVGELDLPRIVETLRELDRLTQENILPRYGAWLPRP